MMGSLKFRIKVLVSRSSSKNSKVGFVVSLVKLRSNLAGKFVAAFGCVEIPTPAMSLMKDDSS